MLNRNLSDIPRIATILFVALSAACAPHAAAPGGLTTPRMRVTNEILEADLAMIGLWRERLDDVRSRYEDTPAERSLFSSRMYSVAKAAAWLSFARDEYATEPRSEVADAALARARGMIEALEQDSLPSAQHAPVANIVMGTAEVHEELWRGAAAIRADTNWTIVATDLAELEVALVRAGRVEAAVGAACRAETHLIRARRLLTRAHNRLAEIVPPVVVVEAPRDTTPKAPEVILPKDRPVTISVHFALDRSELSEPSRKLLNDIVRVLQAHPDYGVVLEGHADPRGRAAHNLALSRRRVESVRDYLASQGVIVDRLEARARGTSERAGQGTSLIDYALDRRVTLQFLAPDGSILKEGDRPSDLQVEESAPEKRTTRPRRSSR